MILFPGVTLILVVTAINLFYYRFRDKMNLKFAWKT